MRLRIIVTGLIAQYPLGGMAWHYLQYVLGLQRLGHDVYYFEDTGQFPYNPREAGLSKRCDFNVDYLQAVLARFGLGEKWAYRFPWQSQWFGLSDRQRGDVIHTADLLLNVSGTLERPQLYRDIRRLVYIDTDPVFTQLKLARGQEDFRKIVDMHDLVFSFGECLAPQIPATGHQWLPTRQPIVLSEWKGTESPRDVYTTVMNWTSYNDVVFEGQRYGQKDKEMRRFLELPARIAPAAIELALNEGKTRRSPRQLLLHKGWRLADPDEVCHDLESYRNYIQSSRGEWTVAKHGYVRGQSGWFSERSACYLAAGRPVVAQDTGFSKVLPTGEGLLSFSCLDEAASAIEAVERNYSLHTRRARSVAEAFFGSDQVLTSLLDRVPD